MYFSTLLSSPQLCYAVLSGRLDAAEHQWTEEVSGDELCAVWGRHLSASLVPSPTVPPLPSRTSLPSGSALKNYQITNK